MTSDRNQTAMPLRERVARALYAESSTDADWRWQEGRWEKAYNDHEYFFRLADAAIKAIQEPGNER